MTTETNCLTIKMAKMKKVIFAMTLLVAGYTLSAQEPAVYSTQTTSSVTYNTPASIQTNFQITYPDANMATWQSTSGWWHATYKGNNRVIHTYYSTQPWYMEHPTSYTLSLPVLNTYVPEEVITSAISTYGNNLYSITKMKSSSDAEGYMVTLLENGTQKIVWLNGESVAMNSPNR